MAKEALVMRLTCFQLIVSLMFLALAYSCFTFFYPHFFDEKEFMKKTQSEIANEREIQRVHRLLRRA